jgi:hypothetical protein
VLEGSREMRASKQLVLTAMAVLAMVGAVAAGASPTTQSVQLAGARFLTAYGEIEVKSGSLAISWEPAPVDYETRWRTYNILLVAEAAGTQRGERYQIQACCCGQADVGENPLPLGVSIEVDGPSAARNAGQLSEAAFPFSLARLESLRSVRGTLAMQLLLGPGMSAPAVIKVTLAQS